MKYFTKLNAMELSSFDKYLDACFYKTEEIKWPKSINWSFEEESYSVAFN